MRKDAFEKRAAEMRSRLKQPSATEPADRQVVRRPPEPRLALSDAEKNERLDRVWTRHNKKLILEAVEEMHPLVVSTARGIGAQLVAHDGLVHLAGEKSLDISVSSARLFDALKLWDYLLRQVEALGGSAKVGAQTAVVIRGESMSVRLREGTDRHELKPVGQYGYVEKQYRPNGRLSFSIAGSSGSRLKIAVHDADDVAAFVKSLDRYVNRQPRVREKREEREREQQAERDRWQARWKLDEEARRQNAEQQQRFDNFMQEVDQWTRAERGRAYLRAFAAHHEATVGPISPGSEVDGWLRWVEWCLNCIDPLMKEGGPKEKP